VLPDKKAPRKSQTSYISAFILEDLESKRKGQKNIVGCMPVDSRQNCDSKSIGPRIGSAQVAYERELCDYMCVMTQKLSECIGIIFQEERCLMIEYQGLGESGDFAGAGINKNISFVGNGIE
jgi:hypothetical protein